MSGSLCIAAVGVLALAASCSAKTVTNSGSDGGGANGACASASAADQTFDPSLHDQSCSVASDCMLVGAIGPLDSAGTCEQVCCQHFAVRGTDAVRAEIAHARASCCELRICGALCEPGPVACVNGQCIVTRGDPLPDADASADASADARDD